MPSFRATIQTRFAAGSGGGTNTFHFRTGVDFLPDDDLSPIMEWLRGAYLLWAPLVPNDTTFTWDGTLSEILTGEPTYTPSLPGWSVTGNAVNDGYTGAASMACVTWRTELASRSGRGRTFLGPLSAACVQADGSLTPDALEDARAGADSLVSQSNTNDNVGAFGVFSPTDNLLRDIVGATVTDQVAVLRSRRG